MGMFMKTLRMTVSVFSLILASAVPGSAQANVFVTGNTTFTVTWRARGSRRDSPGPGHVHRQQLDGHVIRDDGHQRQEHDADKPQHQRTADGVRIRPDAGRAHSAIWSMEASTSGRSRISRRFNASMCV